MDCKTYMLEAAKTAPDFSHKLEDEETQVLGMNARQALKLNAIIGLVGEAAEIQDAYKKVVFQGHPENDEKLVDELGDVFWYAALLCQAINKSFEEVFDYNIKKLRKRYGEHFDSCKSVNREEYQQIKE